jgi:hypothetical protein
MALRLEVPPAVADDVARIAEPVIAEAARLREVEAERDALRARVRAMALNTAPKVMLLFAEIGRLRDALTVYRDECSTCAGAGEVGGVPCFACRVARSALAADDEAAKR